MKPLVADIDAAITLATHQINALRRLRDRVQSLENKLGIAVDDRLRFAFGMSPVQCIILGLLRKRESVSAEQLIQSIYGGLPDSEWPGDPRKTVHSHLCQMSKRLRQHNITVDSKRGNEYAHKAYALSPEAKATLNTVLAQFEKMAA